MSYSLFRESKDDLASCPGEDIFGSSGIAVRTCTVITVKAFKREPKVEILLRGTLMKDMWGQARGCNSNLKKSKQFLYPLFELEYHSNCFCHHGTVDLIRKQYTESIRRLLDWATEREHCDESKGDEEQDDKEPMTNESGSAEKLEHIEVKKFDEYHQGLEEFGEVD